MQINRLDKPPANNNRSIAEHIPAFKEMLNNITDRKEEIIEAAEVLIKYQGYIDRERMIADKIHRLELSA